MNNIIPQPTPLPEIPQNSEIPQSNIIPNMAIPSDTNDKSSNKINKFLERRRRSKHEQEGRIYNCEHCGKSYLSKPALNNHMNTKHADILKSMNIEKRKRGRPRKYVKDIFFNLIFYKKIFFFSLLIHLIIIMKNKNIILILMNLKERNHLIQKMI